MNKDAAVDLHRFLSLKIKPGSEAEGECLAGGLGNAYGGSILAHMLQTSGREVTPDFSLQSIHAHFHAAAAPHVPIRYTPTQLQRSRRFSTIGLMVTEQGRLVASGTVTHHKDEISSHHTTLRPDLWSSPDASEEAEGMLFPEHDALLRQPFELRRAIATNQLGRDGRPVVGLWLRATEPLTGWHEIHKAALAWVSDFSLTRVADLGHEQVPGKWFAATLNHAMWFHRPVDINQWVLYEFLSPNYRAGIAHSSGRFFDQNNELIASASQDCVIRRLPTPNSTSEA